MVKLFFCFVRLKCGIGYLPMIFSKNGRNKSKGAFFVLVVCRPLLVSQEEAEENTIDGGHTKLRLIY